MTAFVSINPATGRRIRTYAGHSDASVERKLRRAHRAFCGWRELAISGRARHVRSLAAALRERAAGLAELATAEMGKPLAQSRAEIEKCAGACEYYAARAAAFLAPEHSPGAPANASVVFEPLGVVLAIMPWNFPFWQVFRAAAPALAAGNTILVKHAANVSGCALALDDLFVRAGLPVGVFQTLRVDDKKIVDLIADPRVQAVTLTGSTGAGRHVAAVAGKAVKKGVYELGGSDAYVILADADLDLAAEVCAASRLLNSGQSCVCAKRFIAVASVQRAFEEKFAARLQARIVGDPRDPAVHVGPLARRDLRATLHRQVKASVAAGARLIFGGRPLPGPGFYYAPTLLGGVKRGMPAYDEELFGPVAALISVPSEGAAIAAANDSAYGLGAAVFSRSPKRAREVAAQIEAGVVFINDFVRSDPSLPFGGVKLSGYGRELGGQGIREFVNVKTIWVA